MDCCGLSSTGLNDIDANNITADNITISSSLIVFGPQPITTRALARAPGRAQRMWSGSIHCLRCRRHHI